MGAASYADLAFHGCKLHGHGQDCRESRPVERRLRTIWAAELKGCSGSSSDVWRQCCEHETSLKVPFGLGLAKARRLAPARMVSRRRHEISKDR